MDDDELKVLVITFGVLFVLGMGVGGTYGVMVKNRDIGEENNKVTIESNIEEQNEIHKFTGNAFTVGKTDGDYFVELFGIAIKQPGATPTFTSLTYKVDEEFYEKAHKFVDIEYQYGLNGQLIGAENIKRNDLSFWFQGEKANWAYSDLIEKLVEVTEERAYLINDLSSVEDLTQTAFNSTEGKILGLTSISNPRVDEDKQELFFEIQAISQINVNENDQAEITLKTYRVSSELNKRNLENPLVLIGDYIKGEANFSLSKEEKLKINNFDIVPIQNDWGAKVVTKNIKSM